MASPTIIATGMVGTEVEKIENTKTYGVKFRICTSEPVKLDNGQWEERNKSWWTVKAWGKTAEQAKETIRKGNEVTVIGFIRDDSYVNKNNDRVANTEIVANSLSVTVKTLNKNLVGSSSRDFAEGWDMKEEAPF